MAIVNQVEELTPANAQRAIDLVREYMIMTEIERGNDAVKAVGLPTKLSDECDHILEAYGRPNPFGLKVMDDGKIAEVCLRGHF